MNAQQIIEIVQYIVCGLAVLFSIAQFIYNKVKGSNSKFLTNFLGLLEEFETSVQFAEQMTKLNGEDKKSFAERSVLMFCENKGIKITDEQLHMAIEGLLKLTKTVNAREKDLIVAGNELVTNIKTDNAELSTGKASINDGETLE